MNLGREFSVPQDKIIAQNTSSWIPATPEKPFAQKPTYTQPERLQNQTGPGNWQDLLGIYQGLLQEESCSGPPRNFHTNVLQGQNRINSPEEVPVQRPVRNFDLNDLNYGEQSIRGVAPVEAYNVPFGNFTSAGLVGRNIGDHNIQHAQRLKILDQTLGITGSYVQNSGNVIPPQKVDSLEDLMSVMSARQGPLTIRSTYIREKPVIISQQSDVDVNQRTQRSSCTIRQSNQILPADNGIVDYNLQQTPNSRLSVPYRPSYNLNLPPGSEVVESRNVARPYQLGPITLDEKRQSKDSQMIQVPHWMIAKVPAQEREGKKDHGVSTQQTEIIEIKDDESMPKTSGTSSAAILTPSGEMKVSEAGSGDFDLNKTPQQKPPKRRKHRPKVIKEGKPKRTPKPKNGTPEGKPTAKRKYVRRKGTETLKMPSTDAANEVEFANTESARKLCRRSLNFDSENGVEKQSHDREVAHQAQDFDGIKAPFNMNLNSHEAERSRDLNETLISVLNDGREDVHRKEKQESENLYNFACSVGRVLSHKLLLVESRAAPPTPLKNHKLNVIARNLSMRNASLMIQNKAQLLENLLDVSEKQGSKGENSHIELTQPQPVTQLGSNGVPSSMGQNKNHLWQNDSESSMKERVDKFLGTSSLMASGITTIEDCLGPIESSVNQSLHAEISSVNVNGGLPNSHGKGKGISSYPECEANKGRCDWYMNSTDFPRQQNNSFQMNQCAAQMGPETLHHLAEDQNTNSLTPVTDLNQEYQSKSEPQLTQENEIRNSSVAVPKKRQKSSKETKNSRGSKSSSKNVIGSREERIKVLSVDYICDRMKALCISNSGKEIVREEQNALVLYREGGGIVPYKAINKRRPRPKVDLDPETNRLWNLLMYNGGSESGETMDSDKQKWWEEERKVFRGRVDSFIARMHLVQGDRRFSRWKGSVVDSVIGVFLTQNVSDHLSSSAFMSLASRFPLKSKSSCQTGEGSSFRHHEVRITYPDGSSDHKIMREPVSMITSCESSEFREQIVMRGTQSQVMNSDTRRAEEDLMSSQSSSESFLFQATEDIRSSSGSNSEVEDQTMGWNVKKKHDSKSFSEPNERIVGSQKFQFQVMGSPFQDKRNMIDNNQFENSAQGLYSGLGIGSNAYSYTLTSNHQGPLSSSNGLWPNRPMDLEKWEADFLACSGKESISYLASTNFGVTNSTGASHYKAGQSSDSAAAAPQTGKQNFHPLITNSIIPDKHLQQINNTPSPSGSINGPYFLNPRMQQTFQQERTFLTDLNRPAEASSKQQTDTLTYSEIQTLEPKEMRQRHSSSNGPNSKTGSTVSTNARKRKAEKEKAEPIDWDTLRKEVHLKPETRGINPDRMDSLDYEALRNADVREISDTIKERGMNNMLAERMKDFLNRVVRDHGRIDLEWLRDVQPDKAKDYLLSIRGLGLKSVECVRLLTLHHLAFPVDTNVGRIAVRLGWVPLQPLPESLQLHLLELYPVLESIQKYLWPRLCKLDQETLYELHYQMITFGKVFCTKREPNCNACPMRGECRHFASAFASARLALPGPEEKRIVRSAIPTTANKSSNVMIKPMPLLSAADVSEQDVGSTKNCEPIIEEPASPEPPTEVTERDIEDAFYEDPDEIPVIKLNIEEFTSNLQSFMQENMEMQEGDMSRALVALSPEVASIPMPKLKHISRLRTEHQVYELPDSHPLLKGLDRREPDDPSPYLLAIWSPGETADSIQPSESKCSSQEGGSLCNRQTCFSCNSTREAQTQTVRGTILIPCRTAMRGSFPLNGTYFQVNELFADHESSINPIDVPRNLLWNLPRRTVFFGTSVSTIFKGLSTEDIQYCFWKGFVCVRGFDRKSRAPRPLRARLHYPASRMAKQKEKK